MKNPIRPLLVASATLAVCGIVLQREASAQEVPDLLPPIATSTVVPTLKWFKLPVKKVPASIMAYWLDPAHQTVPIEFQFSQQNAQGIFPEVSPPKTESSLPQGIVRLFPNDRRGSLSILSSDEGAAELQKIIEVLDKPLHQIEIEVRYIVMSAETMKGLGITPDPHQGDSTTFKRGVAPADIEAQIKELIPQKKATLITAPHVAAYDNQTSSLRTSQSAPALLGLDDNGKFRDVPDLPKDSISPLSLSVGLGIDVRPLFQKDGTLNILLNPGRVLELHDTQSKKVVWRRVMDGVQTLTGLKSGETVALMGGNSNLATRLDAQEKPSNLLLLVKVHVLPTG